MAIEPDAQSYNYGPTHSIGINMKFPKSPRANAAGQLLQQAHILDSYISRGEASDEELSEYLLDIGESLGDLAATLPAPIGRKVDVSTVISRVHSVIVERGETYGPHGEGLERVAQLWTILLGHDVSAHEVALCMAALKLARIHASAQHLDSWVDAAAYLSLGAELAGATEEP